jgi:hypothetical protein
MIVSVYTSRPTNAQKVLQERVSEIASDCEKAIGLDQSSPEFRLDIVGSIGLACGHASFQSAGDASRDVLFTEPPVTVQQHKEGTKLLSRKERKYEAFDLLVKCLAGAYTKATGRRPTVSYSDDYEQGYGEFWLLMEIVLAIGLEVAEADGIRFPQPNTPSARAKKIARILEGRKRRGT